MILYPRTEAERQDALRQLEIINMLRARSSGYYPPIMDDTPWVRICWPKEVYL